MINRPLAGGDQFSWRLSWSGTELLGRTTDGEGVYREPTAAQAAKCRRIRELTALASSTLGLGRFEVLCHLVPVDDFPEGIDVIGTAVLVIQVICMLPDVKAENWGLSG